MSNGAETELGGKHSVEDTTTDLANSEDESKEIPTEDAPTKDDAGTDAGADGDSDAEDETTNDGAVSGDSAGAMSIPATAKRPDPVLRTFKVLPPEERKSTFSKWQTYPVSTSPAIRDVTNVHRRFSDFVWLRNTLALRYAGVFVPPLPPKKTIGRFDSEFIEDRRHDLERFLNRLHEIPLLEEDEAYIAFCSRHEDSFDEARKTIDVETAKVSQSAGGSSELLHKLTHSSNSNDAQLTGKIKEMFPDAQESDVQQPEEAILRLREFLTKSEEQLELAYNTAQSLVQKTRLAAQEAKKFSDLFAVLNDVESNYAQKPELERVEVMSDFQQWAAAAKTQSDLYGKYLQRQIKYELEDIRAFLELIARRTAIAVRCAKMTAKADKWRGDQPGYYPEKQAKQREEDLANEQAGIEYLKTVTNLILGYQIEQMWSNKVDTFRENIQKFAEEQLAGSRKMTAMWANVLVTTQCA